MVKDRRHRRIDASVARHRLGVRMDRRCGVIDGLLADLAQRRLSEMLDEVGDVLPAVPGFHVVDCRTQEGWLFTMRRGFPGRVFSPFDLFFEPPEDGASERSPVSAAALVHSDSEVRPADVEVLRLRVAGRDDFEGHGGKASISRS
jgi:hypothetical protein